jgi:DNA polymerase III sliding clamp (beta) subunit (PCNA family)
MKPQIELPVHELKNVLTGMSKVVTKKGLSSWRCLRISRDENNIIRLQANDLESVVTYRMEQPQIGPTCSTLVPFESLTDSVKGAQGRLVITIDTTERIIVCSRVSQTPIEEIIDVPPLEDWPPIPQPSDQRHDIPWEFKHALQDALACSTGREILSGAFIDISDKDAHYLIGTDGRHLYAANSFNLNLATSVIIPDRKFLGWSGFIDDGPWCMAVQPAKKHDLGWIEIASPRWTIMTRPVEGTYPNWRQVLPDRGSEKTMVMLRPDAVDRMLELLPRLPGHSTENSPVRLRAENGQLLLRGRSRSTDPCMEVPVPSVSIVGNSIEVAVNRIYLLKALAMGLTEMHLSALPTAGVVCRKDGKLLLIAALRMDEAAQAPPASMRLATDPASQPRTSSPVETSQENRVARQKGKERTKATKT